MRTWTRGGEDCGLFAVLYGLLVVALFMVAALVVDISFLREDRRSQRLDTDAGATAGAVLLSPIGGMVQPRAACEQAWTFTLVNLPGAGAPTSPCSSFPVTQGSCPASVGEAAGNAGPWTVSIFWPVPNNSPLMTEVDMRPGSVTQTVVSDIDGINPCERIAIRVGRVREFVLAGAGGFASGSTSNTSVARSYDDGFLTQEVPLVLLEPVACRALVAGGSDGNTIRVRNNGLTPGRIALDSDATGGSGSNDCSTGSRKVEEVNGAGSKIQAWNGSDGKPGIIWNYYPAVYPTSGPARHANPSDLCAAGTDPQTTAGGICPRPIDRSRRVGRDFMDERYHCGASIATCTTPTGTRPDHIAVLRAGQGSWTAAFPGPASVISGAAACTPPAFTTYPPGDYVVDCNVFDVQGTTVFQGGRVTFLGTLRVEHSGPGTGCLILNQPVITQAVADAACVSEAVDPVPAPTGDMVVVVKDDVTRANSHFAAPRTFIYQDHVACPDCQVDLGGGTASIVRWSAPLTGDFEDLALWSETTAGVTNNKPHRIQASTSIGLTGTLFTPNGLFNFAGQPSYFANNAQFISRRLEVSGGALLDLLPDPDVTNPVPVAGVRLIR